MLTYNECLNLMTKKDRKKLQNNTYLQKFIDSEGIPAFSIVLHRTSVVNIYKNGDYELYTGGWYTSTTKNRINEYSPARIFQKKGEWYLSDGVLFEEGVRRSKDYFELLRKVYGK